MLKESLIFIAVIVLPAITCDGGGIKVHGEWPADWDTSTPRPVDMCPVIMDVGFWVDIADQEAIELQQVDIHTYGMCKSIPILCNFDISLSAKIIPIDDDSDGDITTPETVWRVWWTNSEVYAPGATRELCILVENADISIAPGGTNQKVAYVVISVIPL